MVRSALASQTKRVERPFEGATKLNAGWIG